MKKTLKIANAQAFWGDRSDAAETLLRQQPDLDYITLDYLSEVSMSIMAVQREKDPSAGYARDFIDVIRSLIPFWKQGSTVKIITNAGGLSPQRCGLACVEALKKLNCEHIRVGIVTGDDVLNVIKSHPDRNHFENLDTGESIAEIASELVTANAYLGSKPIVDALDKGVSIVITGRCADPSLTVAPCVAHFGWRWNDYDRIAQATVAGHLIECGTQVCGGISTDWLELENPTNIGFPFVEMDEDGTFVITKPALTGGVVDLRTVKEQLLYEIGDPHSYLSPDVTVSFLSLILNDLGNNRVSITGAKGRPPPHTLKVSATYKDGYKTEAFLAIFGPHAKIKAQRCGEIILEHAAQAGYALERSVIECLGTGAIVPIHLPSAKESMECILRISAADHHFEALEYFTKQIAPMVTSGPQGTTGYTSGRPQIRPVFGYWPCLIPVAEVTPQVETLEATK